MPLSHHERNQQPCQIGSVAARVNKDRAFRRKPGRRCQACYWCIIEDSWEKIIAEEQADFRAGRSTTEQIFNLRILCEKYLQHQEDLYHVFINFKKAFIDFKKAVTDPL